MTLKSGIPGDHYPFPLLCFHTARYFRQTIWNICSQGLLLFISSVWNHFLYHVWTSQEFIFISISLNIFSYFPFPTPIAGQLTHTTEKFHFVFSKSHHLKNKVKRRFYINLNNLSGQWLVLYREGDFQIVGWMMFLNMFLRLYPEEIINVFILKNIWWPFPKEWGSIWSITDLNRTENQRKWTQDASLHEHGHNSSWA